MFISTNRIGWFAVLLLLLAGPVLGLVLYRIASQHERSQALAQFEESLSDRAFAIEKEVLTCVESLHALKSFFVGSEKVTRREFASFTEGTLARHPAIQAMEWIPRVSGRERQVHEEQARSEGLTGYRITDHLQGHEMIPSPPRDEYFPVYFVEPYEGNECALGFDLGSDRTRRAALVHAMESGQVTLTDPVVLVQEEQSSDGVLAFLPVYHGPETDARARRNSLLGFVLLAFRVESIVQESLRRSWDRAAAYMQFDLIDPDVLGKSAVMHSSDVPPGRLDSAVFRKTIDLGWQQWQFVARPTAAFMAQHRSGQPLALGIGLFLLWTLMGGLITTLMARSRDAAMRKHNLLLQSVCLNLNEGVVVADQNGKFLLFNEAARKMIGVGATDAAPSNWSETYGIYLPDGKSPYPPEQLPLARALKGEVVAEEDLYISNPNAPEGVWLSISGTPLTGENGRVAGGVVVFRDVTHRKKSTDIVKRLFNAVEITDDTVFITDRRGRIEYVNPAFERTTGYTRSEAIGNTPRILKSGQQNEEHYKELWATILDGRVFRKTVVNRKKSGELYHADQTITPMKNTSGQITHFVSVVKDMTENLKRQEQEVEMQLAALIQQKLYPQSAPTLEEYDIAGAVFSAEATCGDYYDYIPMPGHSLGIVIGDVSGHGFGPALIMAQTRAYLRSLAHDQSDPGRILKAINKSLAPDLEPHLFVTLLLARVDLATQQLHYANAGHNPGYILNESGEVKAVMRSTGMPLGIVPDSDYGSSPSISLEPGDIAVLLTDGVTEIRAQEGVIMEDDAVLEIIRAHRHEPAQQLVQRIHETVIDFAKGVPQEDDITMVILKRNRNGNQPS